MTTEDRLAPLLQARGRLPFAWGVRDCAFWAFDAVYFLTGRDPAPDLRNRYTTAAQALRLLRQLGGMEGLASARFGAAKPVAQIAPHDLVWLSAGACTGPGARLGALGIAWRQWVVAQGDRGLVVVSPQCAVGAWGLP